MSKELNFGDGYDEVKYLDNSTNFDLVLTTNGAAFNLTQADEITVKIANDNGYIMSKDIDPSTITNPENGEFLLPVDDSIMDVLTPDDYYIEVWLKVNPVTPVTDDQSVTLTVDNDSLEEHQSIFPSTGLIGFTIDDNIDSETGEVIPVITFDQFEDQFDDMMAQMQDTVSNVKKGDKGDTGTGLEIKDRVSSVSNLPSTANEGDGYLVDEELYVRVNNAWKDCGTLRGPQGIQGIQGIQGNTGTGVSSTTIQYQISNSATATPTGPWSNNIVATTTTNPYLWMKATLNYDNGTSKSFYLVSSKGDKGDTGTTGQSVWYFPYDIGANGNNRWWSDLKPTPTMANPPKVGDTITDLIGNVYQITNVVVGTTQEGGGLFNFGDLLTSIKGPKGDTGPVGTGLVVKGTVKDASQLPKSGNQEGYCYFVGTDLYVWDAGAWKNCGSVSPDLSNYVTVTDLNNGLSTKVTDNKDGTEQLNGVKVQPYNKLSDTIGGRNLVKDSEQEFTGKAYDFHYYNLASITELTPGTYTMSFSMKVDDKAVKCNQSLFVDIFNSSWVFWVGAGAPISTDYQRVTKTFTVPKGQTGVSSITAYMNHPVINGKSDSSADKSDVAGTGYIKEFKLEQGSVATDWCPNPNDKVNVADMRKAPSDVVGLEDVPQAVVHSELTSGVDLDTVLTPGVYPFKAISFTNYIDNNTYWGYLVVTSEGNIVTQTAHTTGPAQPLYRMLSGAFPGAWSPWVKMANDYTVAHLSGANNFDTIPTVNNSPLLLASSLPSNVATKTDVTNAVNAITPSNSVEWTSLSVDSSQISDTDYVSNNTNCSYRISHNTLYVSGQYVMSGNSDSSHNSNILFKLPTNIVSQISFPSMNKFTIGLLQAAAQQPLMMSVYLTSDGKITCATNPYDVSTTSGAIMASGFINAAIPLK